MKRIEILKRAILMEVLLIMLAITINGMIPLLRSTSAQTGKKECIKWVEFHPTCEAMKYAYQTDVATHGTEDEINWISLLAYAAAKSGGNFDKNSVPLMRKLVGQIQDKETTFSKAVEKLEYYAYYQEAYEAVLGGMVGEFEIEEKDENGNVVFLKKYGLKAFLPIAQGFPYHDYDDFGSSRSFGYKRRHLGHDMMGQIGTPIIAVESGTVEAIGWNRYGGWRIGIRSFDKKRYYYYAHLRQNYPYQEGLKEGSIVTAGDVIGYMGHTGYSDKENVNNINVTHLHFGMELIFDEKRREEGNEIWIDCYELTKFLYQNRSETVKKEGTKEWERVYQMKDPECEKYRN
ncbi:MAG: M23 family metallopeptidase [Lachnospiraceae bacterium]|nr:M23 family metallopeptidase [Lachnospiraceae bacterium]